MQQVTMFKERFNECLQYANVRQTQLAKAANVSKQCISDYKSGKSVPSIDTLFLICRFLEVSADFLLGLSDQFSAVFPLFNASGICRTACAALVLNSAEKTSPFIFNKFWSLSILQTAFLSLTPFQPYCPVLPAYTFCFFYILVLPQIQNRSTPLLSFFCLLPPI